MLWQGYLSTVSRQHAYCLLPDPIQAATAIWTACNLAGSCEEETEGNEARERDRERERGRESDIERDIVYRERERESEGLIEHLPFEVFLPKTWGGGGGRRVSSAEFFWAVFCLKILEEQRKVNTTRTACIPPF